MQALASNSRKLLQLETTKVVNVTVKRRDQTRHVWVRETNASEPLMTHRKFTDDIKTGGAVHFRDQRGGDLPIGCAVSGVQVA